MSEVKEFIKKHPLFILAWFMQAVLVAIAFYYIMPGIIKVTYSNAGKTIASTQLGILNTRLALVSLFPIFVLQILTVYLYRYSASRIWWLIILTSYIERGYGLCFAWSYYLVKKFLVRYHKIFQILCGLFLFLLFTNALGIMAVMLFNLFLLKFVS